MFGTSIYLTLRKHVNIFSSLDEAIKQYGTQAALLAGFAFAGLTSVSYDSSSPHLSVAFAICLSVTIALNLLVVFILGVVSYFLKAFASEKAVIEFAPIIFLGTTSHVCGLVSFLISLILLSWLRFRAAALPITIIVIAIAIVMTVTLVKMLKKLSRLLSEA
jgi:Mediator of CRAC channel activity